MVHHRFPTWSRQFGKLVLLAVVAYCTLAVLLSVVRDSQLEACDRGNGLRTLLYEDALQDAADAHALAGQESDPEISPIWFRRGEVKEKRANSILLAAKIGGNQSAPGLPTVNCADASPEVLPWIQ